jgi:hypothetical protein
MSGLQFKTDGRPSSWQVQSGHGRMRVTGMCGGQQKRKQPPEIARARVCSSHCRRRPQEQETDAPIGCAKDGRHRQQRGLAAAKDAAGKAVEPCRGPVMLETGLKSDVGTRPAETVSSGGRLCARSRVSSICCPLQFACEESACRIEANRAHVNQRWIFNLIRGEFSSNEVVYLDEAEWMLVQGSSHVSQEMRYLVVFKDTALHTIRDLRQRHLPLLRDVSRKVLRFIAGRHSTADAFRLYFHYMPSVFQLHLHVCCNATVDLNRTQDVRCVMRNLQAVDTWYRDALILFSAPRAARANAAPVFERCASDNKRDAVCI